MKILVFPRDPNPYQHELYTRLERQGDKIAYVGELTRSQSLNVLLLPLELLWQRAMGYKCIHVHWVYRYSLIVAAKIPFVRRWLRLLFTATISSARRSGIKVIWFAHNMLPHDQVFDDDTAARRSLVQNCAAIICHSHAAKDSISSFGPLPEHTVVLRIPAQWTGRSAPIPTESIGRFGLRLLYFGNIAEYKGVSDLVAAVHAVPSATLKIVGDCPNAALAGELRMLSGEQPGRVELDLRRVPESDLVRLVQAADAVVLPFRRVTTSGSLLYAMSLGRVVIVPNLKAFAEIPNTHIIRYNPGDDAVDALRRCLLSVINLSVRQRQDIGRAAHSWAIQYQWPDLSRDVRAITRCVLEGA